jgi:hydroxyacylglutathione hydrolase
MTQQNNSILIQPIPALKDNYIWVVINTEQRQAFIVDPGEATPVINYLQQNKLTLSAIFITHHHWDHTNGLADLIKKYEVPIFASKLSEVFGITHFVDENGQVKIDGFPEFSVIEIPGHTLDHIAFYSPGILFCGDTLFAAGCGRIFEGTAKQLYHSLQKLTKLPNDTQIYCGHEYTLKNLLFAQIVEPSNEKIFQRIQKVQELQNQNKPSLPSLISEEKETNPFFRCDSQEIIQQVEKFAEQKLNHPVDVFSALRNWKNQY